MNIKPFSVGPPLLIFPTAVAMWTFKVAKLSPVINHLGMWMTMRMILIKMMMIVKMMIILINIMMTIALC